MSKVELISLEAEQIHFLFEDMLHKKGYECISDVKFGENEYEDEVKVHVGSDHANIQLFKRALQHLANNGYIIKPKDELKGSITMVKTTACDNKKHDAENDSSLTPGSK